MKAGLAWPKWGDVKYPLTQSDRYARIEQMCSINQAAGLMAVSWGLFQVCQSARKVDPISASNVGSDAILVAESLSGSDDARLEEVDFSSTVHLAFYKLQLGDLPLCLSL